MSRVFALLLSLVSCSCALSPALFLPVIRDDRLEAFVAEEAARIVAVSNEVDQLGGLRFYLAKFPREDILGLSMGEQQIFMSYELTRRALDEPGYLWLFRHTLAHEVAHHALSHGQQANLNAVPHAAEPISGSDLGLLSGIGYHNYSRESELAADRRALEYWRKLGWDCRIWIAIFENYRDSGYTGDDNHPTEERLSEARHSCLGAETRTSPTSEAG